MSSTLWPTVSVRDVEPLTPFPRRSPALQVVQPSAGEKFLAQRRADQQRALAKLRSDPALSRLQLIQGPLFDLEVRGLAALTYFGSVVWK